MSDFKLNGRLSVLVAAVLVATGTLMYTSFAATTVGTNFTTDGNLTVNRGGEVLFTMDAAKSVQIDASTTDHTSNALAILDITLDSGMANTDGPVGQTINAVRRSTGGINGSTITIDGSASAMTLADSASTGQRIMIKGNVGDTQGEYYGQQIATQTGSTPGGSVPYNGLQVIFDSTYGGQNLTTTGNVKGITSMINKTGGANTALIQGIASSVANSASGVQELYAMTATVNLNNVTPSTGSAGLLVSESAAGGSTGVLGNGIVVTSDNGSEGRILDGLDVSDSAITNAVNLGNNTVLANGSFTIDLLNAATNDTLTVTNSNGTYNASLSLEGALIVQQPGGSVNVASGGTISSDTTYRRVAGSGGAISTSATTAIADGIASGQILIIHGTDATNTVTVKNAANTILASGTDKVLGVNDTLALIWDASGAGNWIQLALSDN